MTDAQTSTDDRERSKISEPAGTVSKLSVPDLYIQAYTNMRATDEISLRLLAAIPFVSGVGISLLVRKPTEAFPAGARLLVSLFAAVVTFAIYRWERRNIETCKYYRNYAAELEDKSGILVSMQRPSRENRFFSRSWGKTEAEILLYSTVIAGWLATGVYVFFL